MIKQPMKIEDMLSIMDANKEVYPDFAALTQEKKEFLAKLNILSGTAESYFIDGKLIGILGIRYTGLGEIWGLCLPELRENQKFLVFRQAKRDFAKLRDEHNLYKVFATSQISENFLKHLQFYQTETNHIWYRGFSK